MPSVKNYMLQKNLKILKKIIKYIVTLIDSLTNMKEIIRLKDITKIFNGNTLLNKIISNNKDKRKKILFSDLDLSVKAGDFILLTGDNGAGKTTLLKIIAGLITPDSGTTKINGSVSLVSDNFRSFYMRLTLEENFNFFNGISPQNQNKFFKKKEIYDVLDINKLLKVPFMNLSSGQKKEQ